MITRIRELLETRQLTPTQFADFIGVGRPVISHILSERNKPSLEVVQKIIGAFPDVSLSWLLTGTGSMQASTTPDTGAAAVPAPSIAAPPPAPASAVSQPVPPAPVYSSPAPQLANTVAAVATPVPRPTPLPLPPKFRPGTRATSQPAVAPPSLTPTPLVPTTPVEQPVAPAPALEAAVVPAPVAPTPLLVAPPSPVGLGNIAATESAVTETPMPTQASAPAPTEPAASVTNQAAALSFLGEPGKAIRRIVIFYRDGSFSDYVPEGL